MAATIKIQKVIWCFAEQYHKQVKAQHPDLEPTMPVIVVGSFAAMIQSGDAEERVEADGTYVWQTTQQFHKWWFRDHDGEPQVLPEVFTTFFTFGPNFQ
jgi:hypothetical protein